MRFDPQNARHPAGPPRASDPAADEPPQPPDIDLERAAWDADYRRQVLAILRRTGRPAAPQQTTPTETPARDKK